MSGSIDHVMEPYHALLWIFYEKGYFAVDIFFVISGFIYFWLYREKLESKALSIREFTLLRFSRLYPLHILMLVAIAALQFRFKELVGQPFIYSANDPRHFLMSVAFMQRMTNAGFNGPEWSLTVEILMYAVFCALARIGALRNVIVPCILVAIGFMIAAHTANFARGLSGFFAGGITYMLFARIHKLPYARTLLAILALPVTCGWLFLLLSLYFPMPRSPSQDGLPGLVEQSLAVNAVRYALFPATVLLAALHENLTETRYKALAWLGEISYSSYLLHFPLQLSVGVILAYGLISAQSARSTQSFTLYFVVLILLSLLSYRAFERPIQRILRSHLTKYVS